MRNLFLLKREDFILLLFGYLFVQGILGVEAAITGVVKEEEKPEQLFDITFDIDEAIILSTNDLNARVIFESFGTIPTNVEMTFIITDENQNQVYLEKESIVVETEKVFTKKFENTDLDFGKYTLYLKTLYSEDVEDVFLKEFEIRSKIGKSKFQLFDIKFELDRKTVDEARDLTARVNFESFGSEPTPVRMLFTFLDENGEEVYSEEDNAIVETEKILTKEFSYLRLDEGDYTLVLTTLYNVNVEDEFREKFTIRGERNYEWLNWLSFALNFLFVFIVISLLRRTNFIKRGKKKRK